MSGRLRVLLVAEAANPEWTSVPLVGWSHTRAISAAVDSHLVTQIRNRDAIVRTGLTEGKDFTALDSETVTRPICRLAKWLRGGEGKGWTTVSALYSLSYYYFERLVWERFGAQIGAGDFDIVHRITPVSPTAPSLLAPKCLQAGVPFVLGPLNGGVPWPREFGAARRREKEWLSYLRSCYRLLPGYRSTLQSASAILVGSRDTWKQIPRCDRRKCFYVPENAVDPSRFAVRRVRRAQVPVRVVFVGRLVPYKGPDMLIEAAAPFVRNGLMTIDIIGDGPEMATLHNLVRREQVQERVMFCGWVDHRRLQEQLVQADIFALPSIREFGGGAVLEAMSVGLVPIVVNYGGPGELVTDATGFRIEMGRREQIVARLRDVFNRLVADPSVIDRIATAAMRRVRDQFTWERKVEQVVEVYRWILKQRADRPVFPMPVPDPARHVA